MKLFLHTCSWSKGNGPLRATILHCAALVSFVALIAGCALNKPPDGTAGPHKSAPGNQPSGTPSATASDTPSPATPQGDSPSAAPRADSSAGWQSLFDGKSLSGWKSTAFGGRGEITVEDGTLMIQMGAMLSGVTWTNELPKIDYEVELEARKVEGGDFFCGLTFPVGESFCSLIVGGWGGGVVGLSSIDGFDASENETTKYMPFERDRWYHIRLRVTRTRIESWIDNDRIVDLATEDRKISLRPGEIEYSAPFGIATWQTTAALRNIRFRRLAMPVTAQ